MNRFVSVMFLTVGSLLIIFLCVLFFVKPAILPSLDLSTTGQIGDTIGGIAAPIVGIMGAILVYLSFKEQLEANRIQRNALNEEIQRSNATKDIDIFLRLFDQLENNYQNLEYYEKKGLMAVNDYIIDLKQDDANKRGMDPGFEKNIDHLITQCFLLIKRTLGVDLPEADDELTKQMLIYFYKNRLGSYISHKANTRREGTKKMYLDLFNLWEVLIENAEERGYEV